MDDHPQENSTLSPLKQAYLGIERLQARLEAVESARREPVAIVGFACRFPGEANDARSFWQLLHGGVDAIREVPAGRWDIDAFYDPDPNKPGKMSTRWGGFVEDIDHFDPQLFGISPREAASMDPQQRILLEVAWEALENAGQAPDGLAGSPTGVFVGVVNNDYATLQLADGGIDRIDTYFGSGVGHSLASGRISYVFGLQGPSLSIDTACSSSLAAVHLAVQSLRTGECRMALAGGANAMLSPDVTIALSKFNFMAPDGRCKAFDARADGFVRGEGCGLLVLKRLSDAQADGDHVHALILGSAVDQDGASSGLTAPNGPSQELVVRQALENAGLSPEEVSYVEAHGTGTALGDPIEVQALGNVFKAGRSPEDPLWIGSVKTNLGHLESAAGVAGLIKVILALQHNEIPPSLHCRELNPHIPWDRLPVRVAAEPVPWIAEGRRAAGVSSFGFSGANAHVVLASAPEQEGPSRGAGRSHHLLTLSAQSEVALRQLAGRFRDHLERHPGQDLGDIAASANQGRARLSHRLAVIAASTEQAGIMLARYQDGVASKGLIDGQIRTTDDPKIAFLFTGQGAQYAGMGRVLYETQPVFRDALERCCALMNPYLKRPLLEVMFSEREEGARLLDDTAYTQPALFGLQTALVELWRAWGIAPSAVIGHSSGEYAAAWTAGIFSLEDGARFIAQRGRLMSGLPAGGAMAAAFCDEKELAGALGGLSQEIAIAAYNGPANTIISGEASSVDRALAGLAGQGIKSRRLAVSHAFHSHLMDPILEEFGAIAGGISYNRPRLPLISNLTGEPAAGDVATRPEYWLQHIRRPVRFAQGMAALQRMGYELFLEIGPSPALLSMGKRCLPEDYGMWLPSLRKSRPDWEQILHSLGHLCVYGARIDWAGVGRVPDVGRPPRRLPLPPYPFQRKRYWFTETTRTSSNYRPSGKAAGPLVGRRLRSAVKERQYEAYVRPGDLPLLADHEVFGNVILPAAAYIEMALEAAADHFGPGGHSLEDLVIREPMAFEDGEGRYVHTILSPEPEGRAAFRILSTQSGDPDEEWVLHVTGKLLARAAEAGFDAPSLAELGERCTARVDGNSHYRRLESRGVRLGSSLQALDSIQWQAGEAFGLARLPENRAGSAPVYRLHPALLDAGLQLLEECLPLDPSSTDVYLPAAVDRLTFFRSPGAEAWGYASLRPGSNPESGTLAADVVLLDENGQALARMEGLRLRRADAKSLRKEAEPFFEDWLYRLDWQPKPKENGSPGRSRLSPPETARLAVPLLASLAQKYDLPSHHALTSRLNRLSSAYIVGALKELGWEMRPGERVNAGALAGGLGVAGQHRRLFGRLLAILAEDGYLIKDGDEWMAAESPQPPSIPDLEAELAAGYPHSQAQVEITQRCGRRLAGALSGAVDPLQLLFPGGSTENAGRLYQETPQARVFHALLQETLQISLGSSTEPKNLRILEIGAGTGSASSAALAAMPEDTAEYSFTDISPAFLAQARQKFSRLPFMRFLTLDIERDPQAQGFEAGRYDIVLASNVLHATADLRASLGYVRSLLKPGGLLVLLEATAPQPWIDVTFGLTEGWWRFSDADLRPTYPLLGRQAWLDLLEEVDFIQTASIADPSEDGDHALILAQAPADKQAGGSPGDWLVFADGGGAGLRIAEHLRGRGERCVLVHPGNTYSFSDGVCVLPPHSPDAFSGLLAETGRYHWKGVLHCWSLDLPPAAEDGLGSLVSAQSLGSGSLLRLVQALGSTPSTPRLWVVTRGGQPLEPVTGMHAGLVQAPAWGLGRVIRLEHPEYRCTLLDLDPGEPIEVQAQQVLDEITDPDAEEQVAYRGVRRYAARLTRTGLPAPRDAGPDPLRLVVTGSGVLDDLRLAPVSRRKPGPGEVEIRVEATGLNFRDVLNALAVRADPEPLGSECAGTVAAVGEGVAHLSPGDRVMAVAPGSFASYVTVDAGLAALIPQHIDAFQAATFPMAFMTAHYALNHIAGLSAGERVLIHAAAGGVGQAALQIALEAGAQVFATAGSPEKREFLRSRGVQHVMDSRSLDFAGEVLAATAGEGVDVVLNSLAGNFIPAGISVLSERGRFLEIGKKDIWSRAQFARLKRRAAYHVIDLAGLMHADPARTRVLFLEMVEAIRAGRFEPLPYHVFPFEQVAGAFRFMAQAKHTGKILVSAPASPAPSHPRVVEEEAGDGVYERVKSSLAVPDPEGTYLVTGGLSGLGLLVARQLVKNGARHLVLAARSLPSKQAREAIAEMEARGASVRAARCDVSDPARARLLLAEIKQAMPPLRGVIHAAGVLADGALLRQDWPRFESVMAAKVDGAWNLHALTRHEGLDFFTLFSSTSGLLGSAGQGNHAAANSFMDYLAHLRRAEGLPATSINWGVWSQIGSAAQHNVGERVEGQGIGEISPQQGLQILEQIMAREITQVGVFPIHWEQFISRYAHGAPPNWLAEFRGPARAAPGPQATAEGAQPDLPARLAQTPPHKQRDLLLSFVTEQAVKVLGLDAEDEIDLHKPLNEMGLDSLMAVELRNLLVEGLRLEGSLPATLVFDYPSLEALTGYLAGQALTGQETSLPANGSETPGSVDDLLAALEDLPDEEIDRLFTDQLRGP